MVENPYEASQEDCRQLSDLSEDQQILLEVCGVADLAFSKIPGVDGDGQPVMTFVADLLNPESPACAPMLERMSPDQIGLEIRTRYDSQTQ